MKEFIYSEMMVHVGLCTSKVAENILIISDKADNLSAEVVPVGEDTGVKLSWNTDNAGMDEMITVYRGRGTGLTVDQMLGMTSVGSAVASNEDVFINDSDYGENCTYA